MAKYTQANSPLSAVTPLGEDVLLVKSMSATERIGRMFRFDVTFVSEDPEIDFGKIVGENVTIRVQQPNLETRFFDGYVSRFVQVSADGELCEYHATIVPWLWHLTRTSDCRIFQQMNVPDIIKKVCEDAGFTDIKDSLSGEYSDWIYCVQYRETDFNFISRLMEQEGIYYFFTHEEGKHELVLADSVGAHQAYPGYATLPYRHEGFGERLEHVTAWTLRQAVQPGTYTLRDFDFEAPSNDLTERKRNPQKHAHAEREIYDYPGEYTENAIGKTYAGIRLEELHADFEVVTARSNAFGLRPGYLFTLEDFTRQDQCVEHLVTETNIQVRSIEFESGGAADADEQFMRCSFNAIKSSVPYRSPRITPKPLVSGPQTAIVVGKKGEEIWTDEHGRVKVQFHWDREGKNDENSSCWVRVSQGWAGKHWGQIHIPRMGQEVIVEFLEGDPDRPIITGRVYNAEQKVPYGLPDNATQSGIKTRSTKGGDTSTFNEIRFEDKKGEEQLYIHAEKNEDIIVENDKTENVGHDETIDIGNDRTETVQANETLTVMKDRSRTVNQNESVTVALQRTHTVGVNETISVGAAREVTVGATQMITVGNNQSLDVGKNLKITAGDQIVLETGKASILMKKDGTIQIEGKDITIKGSGQITEKASKNIVLKGAKIIEN